MTEGLCSDASAALGDRTPASSSGGRRVWPVEWDKLLKKTEVKLLGRASSSPFPAVWNWVAACLGKGDVVHVQALPFQGL